MGGGVRSSLPLWDGEEDGEPVLGRRAVLEEDIAVATAAAVQ